MITSETERPKGYAPPLLILDRLTLEEALLLKPIEKEISIGIICFSECMSDDKKTCEMVVVREEQEFDGIKTFPWGAPSGHMDGEDIDFFAAARREFFNETGYVARDWEFIGAVEVSSNKPDVKRHFKITVLGRDVTERDKPTEACIREVLRAPVAIAQTKISYNQLIFWPKTFDKMINIDIDHAWALNRIIPRKWNPTR